MEPEFSWDSDAAANDSDAEISSDEEEEDESTIGTDFGVGGAGFSPNPFPADRASG